MVKNKNDVRVSAQENAILLPLESAFERGNYCKVRKLSHQILGQSQATPAVLETAKKIRMRTGNDPYVLWIALFTLLFALVIAWMSLK